MFQKRHISCTQSNFPAQRINDPSLYTSLSKILIWKTWIDLKHYLMDKVVLLSAILCALLFVVDISRSATLYGSATVVTAPGTPEAVDAVKATPKPVSLNVEDTGLHIALCTSCQYVGQYNKIKEVVNQELPGVDVTYSEYPVSFFKTMLGYLIMAVQFGVIAISVGGERILAYFNIPMNDFVKSMMVSKLTVVSFV